MMFPTIDHAHITVSHDATRTGILNLGAEGEQDQEFLSVPAGRGGGRSRGTTVSF